jgi:transposase
VKDEHPGKTLRVFVQDEARLGQQGTLTRVWARTGSRPTRLKQTEYQWVYLWAAVDVRTGQSAAMITPTVNTELMNQFLAGLSGMLGPADHGVLVLDNAGWHVAKALAVPENLTLLPLPPYSPELNPAERVWQYLRSHYLSNRIFADYDDLLEGTTRAWDALDEQTLKSICACSWIERAFQA